jgi:hypothetical protein
MRNLPNVPGMPRQTIEPVISAAVSHPTGFSQAVASGVHDHRERLPAIHFHRRGADRQGSGLHHHRRPLKARGGVIRYLAKEHQ